MKKLIKKTVLYFIIGFIVFFVFRLIYGYNAYPDGEKQNYSTSNYSYNDYSYQQDNTSFEFNRNNYASSKYEYKSKGSTNTSSTVTVDQKYEKIATVSSTSGEFEKDETQIRKVIKNYKSIIQFEQKSGLSNYRSLNLAIGVPPEHFDKMISSLRKIGSLKLLNITKNDKTNEYKELQAKRISLEKTRDALVSLKTHGGSIEELINLENQILSIEQQIQDLGVSLGDYDNENEFCTINLTINESYFYTMQISFAERVKVSIEWTVKYYGITILIFFLLSMSIWVISIILKAFKKLPEENK